VAYAALRGITISTTEAEREEDLIRSMDYLASVEYTLQGIRTSSTQALLYPRYQVELYGYLLPSDSIPQELKNAQMEAAIWETSNSTLTNTQNSNVESKSLDTMSVSYFKGGSKSNVDLKRVNAYLQPLQHNTNRLVRV
jgi:hypothetical protein